GGEVEGGGGGGNDDEEGEAEGGDGQQHRRRHRRHHPRQEGHGDESDAEAGESHDEARGEDDEGPEGPGDGHRSIFVAAFLAVNLPAWSTSPPAVLVCYSARLCWSGTSRVGSGGQRIPSWPDARPFSRGLPSSPGSRAVSSGGSPPASSRRPITRAKSSSTRVIPDGHFSSSWRGRWRSSRYRPRAHTC